MITTDRDARRIIKQAYGDSFEFRLTTGTQIGCRPVYELGIRPMLAWRKLASGKASAVAIGQLFTNGTIDWDYAP